MAATGEYSLKRKNRTENPPQAATLPNIGSQLCETGSGYLKTRPPRDDNALAAASGGLAENRFFQPSREASVANGIHLDAFG
jgi:hypothetical protein